ncbi:MAG: WbuC family cupin fold metalloprotein [Sulfuricella sp.]|nr:WbuC family cupin fold metalloprotein [Sulfuricella sp.]
MPQFIDRALLDHVSAQARTSPRRRKNHNFHAAESDASHRLLNAVEPDSYIQPHCHADAAKDETIVALHGRFGIVFFDATGTVTETAVIEPNGDAVAVNIPHGVFHGIVALAPGSVFFEAKAGPYQPLEAEEKAAFAPAEGEPGAAAYLEFLRTLF